MPGNVAPVPFRLQRWFAGLGALLIGLIAVANGWVISRFLTEQLLQREAAFSGEFVQNVLVTDGSVDYLAHPVAVPPPASFRNSIEHLAGMPDMLRANVYSADRRVLWSTDARIVGRSFGPNRELDEAMGGRLVVQAGRIDDLERGKAEYEGLSAEASFFVETYIPVKAPGTAQVVGVVELYKAPAALTAAIRSGQLRVALAALVGALALYAGLFWLVRRADRTMHRQHQKLAEAETMVAMGELSAALAHNIRNPLASIRSSAELQLDGPDPQCAQTAREIVRDADRIASRVNELLRLARPLPPERGRVELAALVQACVDEQREAFLQRGQSVTLSMPDGRAVAWADRVMAAELLGSLLANARDAMTAGGRCEVELSAPVRGRLRVSVRDTGQGMDAQTLAQAFRPFFTTKPQGLGLGLPLARRMARRLGGDLWLASTPGTGTVACLELPAAT